MDNLGDLVKQVQTALGQNNVAAESTPQTPAMDFSGLGNIASNFGAVNDKSQLLHALRPHLSTRRHGKFDNALRIMQVANVAGSINGRNIGGIANLLSVLGGGLG